MLMNRRIGGRGRPAADEPALRRTGAGALPMNRRFGGRGRSDADE